MSPTLLTPFSRNAPSCRPRALASIARVVVGLVGLVAMVGGGVAHASIMIRLDLPALVKQADHIAVVEVGAVTAAWDEHHERIYSTIQLKVIENWKTPTPASSTAASPTATSTSIDQGAGPDHLTVVQPGGAVGDIRMTVTGMGTFVTGERSLVFLRGPAQNAQVVGMTQGKRLMRYQAASRTWLVTPPDLRQAKLVVRPPIAQTNQVSTDLKQSPLQASAPEAASVSNGLRERPVDELRAEVKQLIGTARP